MQEFKEFEKIARLNREVIATEKIDGTNGIVFVGEDGEVLAGSRTRWLGPEVGDNHGFGLWVMTHRDELREKLGSGYHYGEWWGTGIRRKYGLKEKRFSLFNVARWADDALRPSCCHVVPELARGMDVRDVCETAMARLRTLGSQAAPGFMDPEGVVLFHTAARMLFKVTLEGDESPKSLARTTTTV